MMGSIELSSLTSAESCTTTDLTSSKNCVLEALSDAAELLEWEARGGARGAARGAGGGGRGRAGGRGARRRRRPAAPRRAARQAPRRAPAAAPGRAARAGRRGEAQPVERRQLGRRGRRARAPGVLAGLLPRHLHTAARDRRGGSQHSRFR
ncbi:unnamed protein product [Chrysodeixis includens]|uniref:Uncharacterized protein n=1 Tax=Chrysodeixis includens TaxID=689277 RepID=A0A9N8L038_CHRIL|nr:unnamed protein product [Chrysodeixis includens]